MILESRFFRSTKSHFYSVHPSDKPDHPLSQEEIDVFVTHAYKKVAALQQQLTKLQLLHQAIDQQQLSEQELRKQVMTEEVVHEELEAQKRNLDVEHQQRVAAIREEMESEMRSGMVTTRKAGAIFGTTKKCIFIKPTIQGSRQLF